MYQFLSPLLIFIGLFVMTIIVIRRLPDLAQSEAAALGTGKNAFGLFGSVARMLQSERRLAYQKALLRLSEAVLRKVSLRLLGLARMTEKMLRGVQRRSDKISNKKSFVSFPRLFSKFEKRRAFVEEERKLLEHLFRSPNDIDAYRRLGSLYFVERKFSDARLAFSQILRLIPDDEEAKIKIAEIDEKSSGAV